MKITITSPNELEFSQHGVNVICSYTKQQDSLRVVANIAGTTQALYFQVIKQGLRGEDGTILLNPSALEEDKRLADQQREEAVRRAQKTARGNALSGAAAILDVPAMRKLLEEGADVDARNPSRNTPLMWACWAVSGNVDKISEAVEILISKGCDVNAQATNGKTALIFAIQNQHVFRRRIVKLLLEAHAKPNLGPPGESPLCCEVGLGDMDDPAIVQELIAAGADVNASCNGTGSPLDVALRGNAAVAQILRQAGARSVNGD